MRVIDEYLYKKPVIIVQMIAIFYCFMFLMRSDSYYSVYLICGVFGVVTLFYNCKNKCDLSERQMLFISLISALYGIAIILANWHFLYDLRVMNTSIFDFSCLVLTYLLLLLAGFSIGYNTILFVYHKLLNYEWSPMKRNKKSIVIFAACSMVLMCLVRLLYLFLCDYPGNLSFDSIEQMEQILSNSYSNHHPFWYTMMIKVWISIGVRIFQDINAAIALYSVFQIVVTSGIFMYLLVTLYEFGCSSVVAYSGLIWYAIMPFHLLYSTTMWKDIMFAVVTTLFVTAIFRVFKGIGKSWMNYVCLVLGGMGICLFRSNGFIAFVVTTLVFAVLYRKKRWRLVVLFGVIIISSYILKHPVLKALDVKQPSFVESLSIPIQQIGRVITDGCDLSDEQVELLSKLTNIDDVPFLYNKQISDPLKASVRSSGNEQYLVEHKGEYFRLWLNLGIKHPLEYVEAWADQTKGYWHGGYDYWIWDTNMQENSKGITRTIYSEASLGFVNEYLDLYSQNTALKPFLSIGFHFWIVMIFFCCSILLHRKTECFICVPILAITLTLMIATPVFSEFRYDYALFTSIPLIICGNIWWKKDCRAL